MLNRLFGNFLVEKEKVTQEQLNDILPVPKDAKAEAGTIAMIEKILPPTIVEKILSEIGSEKERFGDVAIETGHLTEERFDKILTYQSNTFMIFIQNLLDNNLCALDQIEPLLNEFQSFHEFDDSQLSALIHDDIEQCVNMFVPMKDAQLKEYVLTLIRTIRRVIDADMYLDKAYATRSFQLDKYACQMIIGDMHVKVYLSAPDNELLAIANYFTNDTYETVDMDALDNVSEFINCVNGQFATNLSYDDISVDMNSPEFSTEGPFLSNEKLYILPIHANGCSFNAVLEVYE